MGKIKVKEIEGDPKDIQLLFKEGNCNLPSYLGAEVARKSVPDKWVLLLIIVLFILLSCIWIEIFNEIWTKISILGAFFLSFFILSIIQSNYRSKAITAIVSIALLMVMLLVFKIYSPQEVIKKIEKIATKKYDQ